MEVVMGQGSLFGGEESTRLELEMGFVPNKGSGWLHVGLLDQHGRALVHRNLSWTKERDLSGIGDVLRLIAQGWLYMPPEDVWGSVAMWMGEHCPPIAAADDRRR
jgi:hypothetical protein